MLPKLHLISHVLCPYVQRAVITLLEKEIVHERTYIDLADKPEWFQRMSPLGKVPLLIIDDREVLFESAVICDYLDEITPGTLYPVDPLKRAKHRAWIEFGSNILNTIAGFYNAVDEITFEQKRQDLVKKFTWLENHLGDRPYFDGERFSLVDAAYSAIFRYFIVFDAIADFHVFAATPAVQNWRSVLQDHPSVQSAVVDDYPQRLHNFLKNRRSYLTSLIV
jgi:glutathione S-transferase